MLSRWILAGTANLSKEGTGIFENSSDLWSSLLTEKRVVRFSKTSRRNKKYETSDCVVEGDRGEEEGNPHATEGSRNLLYRKRGRAYYDGPSICHDDGIRSPPFLQRLPSLCPAFQPGFQPRPIRESGEGHSEREVDLSPSRGVERYRLGLAKKRVRTIA